MAIETSWWQGTRVTVPDRWSTYVNQQNNTILLTQNKCDELN